MIPSTLQKFNILLQRYRDMGLRHGEIITVIQHQAVPHVGWFKGTLDYRLTGRKLLPRESIMF